MRNNTQVSLDHNFVTLQHHYHHNHVYNISETASTIVFYRIFPMLFSIYCHPLFYCCKTNNAKNKMIHTYRNAYRDCYYRRIGGGSHSKIIRH